MKQKKIKEEVEVIPLVKPLTPSENWKICQECRESIWKNEWGTAEFYHKLDCSKSNGIGYGSEKAGIIYPHKEQCPCTMCTTK